MKRFLLFLFFVAASASSLHSQSGNIFPDKMNVFYIGVDNPVTVTIPGVSPDMYMMTISGCGGTMSGSRGKYTVRVTTAGEVTISLSYKNAAGKAVNAGAHKFRAKRVPDPVAYVDTVTGFAKLTSAEAANMKGVYARMQNFDFDFWYKINSFNMTPVTGGKQQTTLSASGPALTPAMTNVLKNLSTGDRLSFENIEVKGSDGSIRKIPGVMIEIK